MTDEAIQGKIAALEFLVMLALSTALLHAPDKPRFVAKMKEDIQEKGFKYLSPDAQVVAKETFILAIEQALTFWTDSTIEQA